MSDGFEINIKDIEIPDLSIGDINFEARKQGEEFDPERIGGIEDLTNTTKAEIGESLQKIKEFEGKFKERWEFDGDARYYFSICFRSGAERDEFCKKHGIKLRCDDHVFVEEINDKFKEVI